MNTLFTIGHSNHLAGQLISLLRSYNVKAVVDVRSHPHSQRLPQFNRDSLEANLKRANLYYVFLGCELGARREERECYVDNRADYGLIAKTAAFQEGLKRVRQGLVKMSVALLCAEHDPLTCHRMILVCRHLRADCPDIQHILRDGNVESNQRTELRLVRQFGNGNTLVTSSIIEKAYDLQGKYIAYSDECTETEAHDNQLHFLQ